MLQSDFMVNFVIESQDKGHCVHSGPYPDSQLSWLYQVMLMVNTCQDHHQGEKGMMRVAPGFPLLTFIAEHGYFHNTPRVGNTHDQWDIVYLNSGIRHQRLPRTLPWTNGSPFFPKNVVNCGTLNSLPCNWKYST